MNGSMDFGYDWTELYSESAIKKDLNGIPWPEKVKEGWYLSKTDTLLVVHKGKMLSRETSTTEEYFRVYVWNRPSIGRAPDNVGDIFNQIVNAPTQFDQR